MMVVASDSAEVADAIGPSPSGASLRGLDGVNLLIAAPLNVVAPTQSPYGTSMPQGGRRPQHQKVT